MKKTTHYASDTDPQTTTIATDASVPTNLEMPVPPSITDPKTPVSATNEPASREVSTTMSPSPVDDRTASETGIRRIDVARLRLPDDHLGHFGFELHVLEVAIRKSKKNEWIQTRGGPAWQLQVAVVTAPDQQDSYFILTPEILSAVRLDAVPMLLIPAINTEGVIFLVPVPLPGPDGRHNPWHRSLLMHLQMAAEGRWVRIIANQSRGAYDAITAPGDLGQPRWPEGTFGDLLEKALRDRLIDSLDHPVLRRLRGES